MPIQYEHLSLSEIKPSNAEAIVNGLVESIGHGHYNGWHCKKVLADMFHYTVEERIQYPLAMHDFSLIDDHHEWNKQFTQDRIYHEPYSLWYSTCRPTIEALFFEHPEKLLRVVAALANQDREELFNAFIESLKDTDLNETMLFAWSDKIYHQLHARICDMTAYGHTLQSKKITTRGEALTDLSAKLKDKLETFPHPIQDKLSKKQQFELLKNKLEFMSLLHSSDALLNIPRQPRNKIIFNLLSLLFLGIPNVINWVLTGNFLFFNKTTSMQKVSAVQHALKFG